MKKLLLLCVACCTLTAYAQDVIVKRDGSTILTKVLEVNQTDIKYKKFSNQQGPTYTINKSEVMAINYEGGDKDTFEDAVQPAASTSTASTKASTPFGVNPNLVEDNLKLVREFNSHAPIYLGNDTNKACKYVAKILGIAEGSIIETPEIKADFAMKNFYGKRNADEYKLNIGETPPASFVSYSKQYRFSVILKNKTNKTIYIDLSNCYIIQDEEAKPYYLPTATTKTHGKTNGGSVNLGAIAGVAGIGGTLGTLADGVNVGSSSSNVNTETTFSQRVVSIPPKSSLSLEPKEIGQSFIWITANKWEEQHKIWNAYANYFKEKYALKTYAYFDDITQSFPKDLKRGEVIDIPYLDNIHPLGLFLTYSFDEVMTITQSMRCDFYLRQIMGTKDGTGRMLDYSKCPLIFF